MGSFELGLERFESGNYEDAIIAWIEAYESGENCQEILSLISECFILPNENEFKEAYESQSEGQTRIPLEMLPLVFIPVNDDRYYIFDAEENRFQGYIDLTEIELAGRKLSFHSMLVSDVWDVRKVAGFYKDGEVPYSVHIIPSDEARFASFYQIPGIVDRFMANWLVFPSKDIMKTFYMEMSDIYLPKNIVSAAQKEYQELLWEVHEHRIRDLETRRNNIFISFCIPSYNRGKVALETVKHLLKCSYDSEIEIVVSNNGSTQDTVGYEIIKNMKDSRIKYYEFPENTGIMNNGKNAVEIAEGKWAALQSDEDKLYFPELLTYLNDLLNNDYGLLIASTKGPNGAPKEQIVTEDPNEKNSLALSTLYYTGCIYNTKNLRKRNAFRLAEQYKDMAFLAYIQTFLALMASIDGKVAQRPEALFIEGAAVEESRDKLGFKGKVPIYLMMDNRIRQYENIITLIVEQVHLEEGQLSNEIVKNMSKFYWLMKLAINAYPELFAKDREAWEDVAKNLYSSVLSIIDRYSSELKEPKRIEYCKAVAAKIYEQEKVF